MKTKKSLKFRVIVPVTVVIVLAIGGALVYSLIPRETSADKAASTATFEFDASKAPGWFAGANIDGDSTNASAAPTSKKLATTTRMIAQGTAEKPEGNCFVQYSYWADNSKDIDQALNELVGPSDPSTTPFITLDPTGVVSLTMKTPTGDTPFQLHQYDAISADSLEMSKGEEFAVLKAGTGYIDIRGYCKTSDELSVTLPVFSAVSFKP